MKVAILSLAAVLAPAVLAKEYFNEIKIMEGHKKRNHVLSPLPHT